MGEDRQTERANALPPGFRKRTAWAAIALTAIVFATVFPMARWGGRVVEDAERRNSDFTLRQGQRFERTGAISNAIGAYRKALQLGIDNPSSRDGTMQRMGALLLEHGRAPKYLKRTAASLVTGGAFDSESDRAAWTSGVGDDPVYTLDTMEKVEGRSALRIDDPGTKSQPIVMQAVHVVPGKAYEVSLWTRAQGKAAGAAFCVSTIPDDRMAPDLLRHEFSADHEWTQGVFSLPVPNSVRRLFLALEGTIPDPNSSPGSSLWIDDVSLREAQPSLLANGSFEYGESGRMQWLGETGNDVHTNTDTEIAMEGRKSLRIDLLDGANLGLWQTVDVSPGARYRLEGWIRAENLGDVGACLEVQDADRGWQTFCAATAPRITGTQDWQRVSMNVDVPAETRALSVLVRRQRDTGADAGNGVVWFDACHFARIEGAAP